MSQRDSHTAKVTPNSLVDRLRDEATLWNNQGGVHHLLLEAADALLALSERGANRMLCPYCNPLPLDDPNFTGTASQVANGDAALKNAAPQVERAGVAPSLKTPEVGVGETPAESASAPCVVAAPEDMVLLPLAAVKLAWSIVKERRDELFEQANSYEIAERELEQLSDAGFEKHLPTLHDLRGILKSADQPTVYPPGTYQCAHCNWDKDEGARLACQIDGCPYHPERIAPTPKGNK